MAKTGAVYPQVEATAGALIEGRTIACPPECRVTAALIRARRAHAQVLVVGNGRAVRRRDLLRATRWRLGGLRAAALAWHGLPAVASRAPEVKARRLVLAGSPLVLVRDAGRVLGVIDGERVGIARPRLSLVHRLDRGDDATLWLLRVAGKVGEGLGMSVFVVGGFVRDLLLARPPRDVDLLVEGDGVAFARRLAEEVGGHLRVHSGFCTASIEGVTDVEGTAFGRIDVASARREHYPAPGALPVVSGACVDEDLRRRDFSVNAMAMALSPAAFGRLLDPLGGRLDLERRRLRPLSPLSFVEDPTRIFRAARYAVGLGFRLDSMGRQALRLALEVGVYPALSGERLRAELELLAREPAGERGLELLLKWRALKIWDPGYQSHATSSTRVRMIGRLARWARRTEMPLDLGEVALVALLVDQARPVIERCLDRLGIRGRARAMLEEATASAPLARRLDRERLQNPSEVAELLRPRPEPVLAGAWLLGGRRARRRIQWFWSRGRAVRPLLSGDDVVSLGVRRGPAVGECLAALRRRRLDGALTTLAAERSFVDAWLDERSDPRGAAGRDDRRRGGAPTGSGRAPARGRRRAGHARRGAMADLNRRCV
jgi:tRNA nucleotidyltransferase/poly(A) polymerase